MLIAKSNIIDRLKTVILPLGGLRAVKIGEIRNLGLEPINESFPLGCFPLGVTHEFLSEEMEMGAFGFLCGILNGLMKNNGAIVWIGSTVSIFPPALNRFGINPDRILFIELKKEKDILWAIEEALKCEGLAAVVGEIPDFSFTESRRFQLAVEQSGVTGFLLRSNPRYIQPNACVSRWKIKSIPSESENGLPGVGFPRWHVELQKIRNGKPGSWIVEWEANQFRFISSEQTTLLNLPEIIPSERKTG